MVKRRKIRGAGRPEYGGGGLWMFAFPYSDFRRISLLLIVALTRNLVIIILVNVHSLTHNLYFNTVFS